MHNNYIPDDNIMASAQKTICPFVFNGQGGENVEMFLENFEEFALVSRWSDIEKRLQLKLALKDNAKIWLTAVRTDSFEELKDLLIKRFTGPNKILTAISRISNLKYVRGSSVLLFLDKIRAEASLGTLSFEIVIAFF